MTKKTQDKKRLYDNPGVSLGLSLLSFAAAVAIGMRSLDTGSWQQYFMTLGFTIYGINRLGHTVIYLFKGKTTS